MLNSVFLGCRNKIQGKDKLIKKVLIANRSEIACRIIKSCKAMGIETVAIYSDADANALHVKSADFAVHIGESEAKKSYLDMDKVIRAAVESGCDAVHPGYGFLSENHEFNRKVRQNGLIFIGPSAESMELMGSKTSSRTLMIEHGIPVVPGMFIDKLEESKIAELADEIGYPILIKAAAGGGGKGMRVVRASNELISAIESARRESMSAFGSDEVFIEKYVENPRHIEFQIAADQHGNIVHLFERECSIQRRHQKIIEETPSTALTNDLREKMGEVAKKVCQVANYNNLGTVEFLFDNSGNFYFLEVNARIQVEHPITEETTGIDLVKLQIDIANDLPLPFEQNDLKQTGHAIECRIYAEDGDNDFLPSSGKILMLKTPVGEGVRYDSGIETGSDATIYYDPILAKLIVHANDRESARLKMIAALKSNVILGVKTSINFMIACLESDEFKSGDTYTSFIALNYEKLKNYRQDELLNLGLATANQYLHDAQASQIIYDYSKSNPWLEMGNWEICSKYEARSL